MTIDPEMVKIAVELSRNLGISMRKIMLENGMTPEQIEKTTKDALGNTVVCGVPMNAIACEACNGRGYTSPKEDDARLDTKARRK